MGTGSRASTTNFITNLLAQIRIRPTDGRVSFRGVRALQRSEAPEAAGPKPGSPDETDDRRGPGWRPTDAGSLALSCGSAISVIGLGAPKEFSAHLPASDDDAIHGGVKYLLGSQFQAARSFRGPRHRTVLSAANGPHRQGSSGRP